MTNKLISIVSGKGYYKMNDITKSDWKFVSVTRPRMAGTLHGTAYKRVCGVIDFSGKSIRSFF